MSHQPHPVAYTVVSIARHCKALLILLKIKQGKRHSSYTFTKQIQLTDSVHILEDEWIRQKETVFMEHHKVRKRTNQLMKQFRFCSQGSLSQMASQRALRKEKTTSFGID